MPKREVYPPHEHQYAEAGCWITLLVISVVGWIVAAKWAWLAWLSILLTAPLGLLVWDQLRDWRARRDTWRLHARGIKGLVVYSQSPNWQTHIEENWLSRLGPRVEVLDWSTRRQWRDDDVRVRIFRRFVQSHEDYNPAAVVFRRKRPPLVFRFYPAFKNAKHGNVDGLSELEKAMFEALDQDK